MKSIAAASLKMVQHDEFLVETPLILDMGLKPCATLRVPSLSSFFHIMQKPTNPNSYVKEASR